MEAGGNLGTGEGRGEELEELSPAALEALSPALCATDSVDASDKSSRFPSVSCAVCSSKCIILHASASVRLPATSAQPSARAATGEGASGPPAHRHTRTLASTQ